MSMDDLISRQAAVDAVKKNTFRLTFAEEQNCEGHVTWSAYAVYSDVIKGALLELPSAQPEEFEWCTDCKEYDQERHCCPRWTKVIRNTVAELKAEQQWIPIGEKMPPLRTEVLATSNGYVTIAEWCGGDKWFIQEGNSNATTEDVEAWMELPKPYEV